MVVMLVDHVAQHAMSLLLPRIVADSTSAPEYLFPNHNAELVAEIENDSRLLIVRQPNEVRANVFDHLHFFSDQVFGHGGPNAGVILVSLRSANEQALAIQLERAMRDELELANAEAFTDCDLAFRSGQSYFAAVK